MATIRKSPDTGDAETQLSAAITGWLLNLRIEDLFQTCLSCRNLMENGTCRLYPNHPIPPHIVINACERYKDDNPKRLDKSEHDDDIPF